MSQTRAGKGKVAILVENDYQDMEVWVPLYRLREAGYVTPVVAPSPGRYLSKHGYPIQAEVAASDVDPSTLSGLVIPGGWAPDRLRQDAGVLRLVQAVASEGKVVAAICHAGWVLASAGVARGRRLTCYAAIRDDMVHAGAEYVDREVVRDGNLITSRQPDDLPAFCATILAALAGD
jgi:protease I